MQRILPAIGFLLLLIPSIWLGWKSRDLPQFAVNSDDGIYYITAKSLADGSGYRIISLPEEPYQTKYPPLFPLYLSLAWIIQPSFPQNLATAAALAWLTIPVLLLLSWKLYVRWGFHGPKLWLLLALLAVNPYLLRFGIGLFSELFFTCFALGALLWLEKEEVNPRDLLIAGVLAGLAYLARTAGIAFLISVPAVFLWQRKLRHTLLFTLPLLPAVAGWMLWTHFHKVPEPDEVLSYYTDYLGYYLRSVSVADLPVMLWKDLDSMVYSIGSMVMPQVAGGRLLKIVTQVLAVAMISGIVRLVRQRVALHFATFGLVSALMLAVWNYPPNERFLLPLITLLMAGFVVEMEHLQGLLRRAMRHKDRSQRVVAMGMAGVLAVLLGTAVVLQFATLFYVMPVSDDGQREINASHREAYACIERQVSQDASLVAYFDAPVYLSTGRHAIYIPMPTHYWYREDHAAMAAFYQHMKEMARPHGIQYLYLSSKDFYREMNEQDSSAVRQAIQADPSLTPVCTTVIGTIYRFPN